MSSSVAVQAPLPGVRQSGDGGVRAASRVIRAGRRPVSPQSAAVFRVAFGLLGVAAVIRFAANGWIDELYIEPAYHFSYYGFGWVKPWPGWGMYLHFALLGLASLGVALGYRYRLSIAAFFLLFTYVELIDKATYLNHYYFISLISLIMIFLPLNRALSLDSRRAPPNDAHASIPLAVVWMLRAQVGMVYAFAGLAKVNPDWLFNAQPLRIWLFNSGDALLLGWLAREPWAPYAMSWTGALFDLTIVGWLLYRRTRPVAFAVLVTFHVLTGVLFPTIGVFPWVMMGAALIFFDPDWPSRVLRRLRGLPNPPPRPDVAASRADEQPITWLVRAAFVLAAVFLAVQVVAPLRHLAYPGNVRWNEEGYRFSWRVLVTEKTGIVKFRVSGDDLDGERLVYPEEYLTPVQVERMAFQPDMILATAHIIRDDFAARGHEGIEVRADALVAYNGRAAAPLIDPDVDLAALQAGIAPKHWVLNR